MLGNLNKHEECVGKEYLIKYNAKYMTPYDNFTAMLDEHGSYCPVCEWDEDELVIDISGNEPKILCLFCGYSITLNEVIKHTIGLPADYLTRMVPQGITRDLIAEMISEDMWVTNGVVAEIAGDINYSYPERECFVNRQGLISSVLQGVDINLYKEATVSRIAYRDGFGTDIFIALLESGTYKTYIKNEYVKYIVGIFVPYITSNPLSPVLVKKHDKVVRLIMPMRFSAD